MKTNERTNPSVHRCPRPIRHGKPRFWSKLATVLGVPSCETAGVSTPLFGSGALRTVDCAMYDTVGAPAL